VPVGAVTANVTASHLGLPAKATVGSVPPIATFPLLHASSSAASASSSGSSQSTSTTSVASENLTLHEQLQQAKEQFLSRILAPLPHQIATSSLPPIPLPPSHSAVAGSATAAEAWYCVDCANDRPVLRWDAHRGQYYYRTYDMEPTTNDDERTLVVVSDMSQPATRTSNSEHSSDSIDGGGGGDDDDEHNQEANQQTQEQQTPTPAPKKRRRKSILSMRPSKKRRVSKGNGEANATGGSNKHSIIKVTPIAELELTQTQKQQIHQVCLACWRVLVVKRTTTGH
jgi:hypothetical protein